MIAIKNVDPLLLEKVAPRPISFMGMTNTPYSQIAPHIVLLL